ncbi:choice-of-anchor D domain-containing protein [Hymenobacter sp. UYCo722]|uniref:choice-of-anchor D domain-containing protein n=1 Tax=Hymenobacter sp. UYCo722 TaxID=3156335 RepID=UPI00339571EB
MHTLYTKGQSFRWMRLLSLLLLLPLAGRAQVVISQVYAAGGSGVAGTTYTRDYVELFNRGTAAIDISGYAIQYAAGATTTGSYTANAVTATPGTPINLQPGQYYTVVLGGAGTAGATIAQGTAAGNADYVTATTTSSLSNSQGKLALTNNTTALAITTATTPPASAALQDFVGYGATASAYEGTAAAPAPTNTTSALFRGGNGCTDTNSNVADFANAAPGVRNRSTTLAPCGGPVTPAEINVKQGTTTYLTGSTYSGFATTTTGSTDVKTFTIENLGGTVLNVSGIVATGDFSVTGTVPTMVAANGTASFNVTFTPTAIGTRTGTVTVANDDADEATYVINLSAQAVAVTPNPLIAVSQAGTAYADASTFSGFANTFVGSTSPVVTFTITNASTTDALTITGIATTGNFAVSGTVPTTVAANGGTATFDLTFTPTAAGTRTGTVVITNNSQGTPSYSITLNGTGVTPVPTLTSASPTSLLVGISSPVILTGTSLTGSTVNFNGGTLTPSSVSATSVTVRVAAPSAGTFPVSVTTPGGTSNTVDVTATTPPAGFFEPFEAATQSTYVVAAGGTAVALTTGSWNLFQGLLLNSDASDKKNNAQSVRLRGGGTLAMNFDKTTGAGLVTVNSALYGTDTGASFVLEYSTDGGTNYTVAGTSPVLTSTLTAYPFTLNVAGNVRLRLSSTNLTAGLNPRINIDDLQIGNFTAAVCDAPTGLTPGSITSSSATVSFTGSASAANGYTVTTMPVTTTQMLAAGATSVSFSGLMPATAYAVSIVSNCSTTSTSSAAMVNFTTLALAPTLAVTQAGTSYPSGGTAYGFGNQTVSTTSAPVSFTLTNNGPDALTISSITPTGDYAVSGAAPTTVAANGGTATVSATFTPTATGTRSGSLVINSDATNGAVYTVNLTGNGQAAALPDLVVSNSSPITPVSGNYNNVTITSTGRALLVGPLTVAGTLTVQAGGVLSQNCQLLTGTGNFDLQAGAALAICDAAGISPTGVPTGAVLLTGTRTYSPGAIYAYNGTVLQITGLGLPTTVLSLGVQNPAGVNLSQGVSLVQGLQLQAGNLSTNGQSLTLLSSAASTALVVNVGGVVNGAVTVQRYINSTNAIGYRHYSAPVSNTTFADLNATGFSPVFNSGYNSSATPGTVTPFPTVFGYNQDRIATVSSNFSAFDKGWFSPAGPGDPMVVGKGYTVNTPNTALIDFVGSLNNGPVPSGTLSRGTDAAAGWHLLGNPYPSPLDWSTVAAGQRPGMDAAIYVFESAGQYGGSYRASVNGVGGNGNSPQPLVVAAHGYFVRVATGQTSGQVNLNNSNRVTTFGTQPDFGRGTADTRPQVALTLQGTSVSDDAYVYFQAGATAGKDVEFDATKLANSTGLNLTSLAGGEALAINGLPVLGSATVLVPLNVAAPQAGSYSLKAGTLANLAGTTVTLIDALTSTRTVLTAGTAYAFSLSSTTATGRFSLEFRPGGALATTAAQALAAQTQLFPNPASGSFRVQLPLLAGKTTVQATLANALGQTVLSRTLSAAAGQAIDAEFDVRVLAAGVYTLRLNVNGTPVVRKVVVE